MLGRREYVSGERTSGYSLSAGLPFEMLPAKEGMTVPVSRHVHQ